MENSLPDLNISNFKTDYKFTLFPAFSAVQEVRFN
jgi:hypothetical protein